MSRRPSVTIGIQPQIALYTVILGSVCALAAYTEKYRRNQEDIDDEIKLRYSADIKDAQSRMPQMTARIRGQDDPWLDQRMDKLVWGGKAHLVEKEPLAAGGGAGGGFGGTGTQSIGNGPAGYAAASRAAASNFDDDSDRNDDDDTDAQRKKILKKERKRRKGKDKKSEQKGQQHKEEDQLQSRLAAEERQKLVMQSAVGGVVVGAAVVAASVLLGGASASRK